MHFRFRPFESFSRKALLIITHAYWKTPFFSPVSLNFIAAYRPPRNTYFTRGHKGVGPSVKRSVYSVVMWHLWLRGLSVHITTCTRRTVYIVSYPAVLAIFVICRKIRINRCRENRVRPNDIYYYGTMISFFFSRVIHFSFDARQDRRVFRSIRSWDNTTLHGKPRHRRTTYYYVIKTYLEENTRASGPGWQFVGNRFDVCYSADK